MAEEIQVVPFQEPKVINNIFYSQRRLFNIQNSDNSISVGYLTQPSEVSNITTQNNTSQLLNLTGVGDIAILGSFGADSNQFTPGPLSTGPDSAANGNERISNAIFSDPNYHSLITNSNPTTTSTSPAAGTDGFGDSSVTRVEVSSPTSPEIQGVSSQDVRYPLNISDDQDYVQFNVVKLETRELGSTRGLSGSVNANVYTPVNTPEAGTIIIGTQAPIYERTQVGWGDDSLNALQMAAANLSVDAATSGFGGAEAAINEAYKATGVAIEENSGGIQGALGALAAGLNPGAVFSRSQRKIINPNLELLFSAPSLRPFTFEFKFAARELKEAQMIKKIIKYFKQNMVPRVDTSGEGLFLQAPYVFTIQYMNGKKGVHKSINLISESPIKKACALVSCDVNYTPLSTYMTFADDPEATMVAYQMSLQFQEIEPIYSKDYESGPGKTHSIGY